MPISISAMFSQPGVLGRVVELDAAQKLCGCAHSPHLVESLPDMGVQVVQHQMHTTGIGVCVGEQPADEGNEVNLAPMLW